ncbi:MAG: glycine/sarcosine/betaine reductase component B subunit [Saccharofermentanales bacterium]|jgi:sarcosine reductase
MKLVLGYFSIEDVQFAEEPRLEDGVLFVDEAALSAEVLADERLRAAHFEIARPGESVRIIPVKDVIQPRVKVEGGGEMFPGMASNVDVVGSGTTYVLEGMSVVTVGPIVGFQEGVIDMSGPGEVYSPFSQLNNLVLVVEPAEGVTPQEYEQAVRLAGLKTAMNVAELVRELTPERIEEFEHLNIVESSRKYPDLPRVAYVQMLQSQGLLHDTYVYGVDAKRILPTLISPTETMDGAIVSGNCVSACDKNTTYHHLNNPVIADLYKAHGETLNFVGMVITNENVYLADKIRSSNHTAELCSYLGLDGVIISQEGFGNPDTDLIMNCTKIEDKGIKTVIITDEYAGRDGKSQSLADASPKANAVVTGGNANMLVEIPPLDKVIGSSGYINVIAGGHAGSLKADGAIEAEIQVYTGATNELGFNKMSAR